MLEAGDGLGLRLVGSRALGCLRLEKGYRSWGAELNVELSPAMAGLEHLCRTEKGEFVGRRGLLAQRQHPPARRLATLVVDTEGADCWGTEPLRDGESVLGHVTSGGYGWRVGKSLAVGLIPRSHAVPGTALEVEILGVRRAATVVADPIYDPDNVRLRG